MPTDKNVSRFYCRIYDSFFVNTHLPVCWLLCKVVILSIVLLRIVIDCSVPSSSFPNSSTDRLSLRQTATFCPHSSRWSHTKFFSYYYSHLSYKIFCINVKHFLRTMKTPAVSNLSVLSTLFPADQCFPQTLLSILPLLNLQSITHGVSGHTSRGKVCLLSIDTVRTQLFCRCFSCNISCMFGYYCAFA